MLNLWQGPTRDGACLVCSRSQSRPAMAACHCEGEASRLGVQTLTRSRSAIIFNSLLTTAFVLAGDISFLISFMGMPKCGQATVVGTDTRYRHHRVLGCVPQPHRPSVSPHPGQFASWERPF